MNKNALDRFSLDWFGIGLGVGLLLGYLLAFLTCSEAHAAFEQTAEFSGYGVDEVTTPESAVTSGYTIEPCGGDICAIMYPRLGSATTFPKPLLFTDKTLAGLIDELERNGVDASICRAALADLVRTKIILKK